MAVRRGSRAIKASATPAETPMLPPKKRSSLSKVSKRLSLPTPKTKAGRSRAGRKSAPAVDYGSFHESDEEPMGGSGRSVRKSRTRTHYVDLFLEDNDLDSFAPSERDARRYADPESDDERYESDNDDGAYKGRGRPSKKNTGKKRKSNAKPRTPGSRKSSRAVKHSSFSAYFDDDDLAFINRKTFGRISDKKDEDRSLDNKCYVKLTPLHKITRYRKYLSKSVWKNIKRKAQEKRRGRKKGKSHKSQKEKDAAYQAPVKISINSDSPSRKSARASEVTYVTYLSDFDEDSEFSESDYVIPKKKPTPNPAGKTYGGDHSLRKKKRVKYGEDLMFDYADNPAAKRARASRAKKRGRPKKTANSEENGMSQNASNDSTEEADDDLTNTAQQTSYRISPDISEGGSNESTPELEDDVEEGQIKGVRKNARMSLSFDSGMQSEDGRRPMKKRRSARKGILNSTAEL